jgi:(p)ppGpp synthase/HD superfamily hydrolase
VHTDAGDQTISARVNQATRAALRFLELQNGDVVEIITDPTAKPNPAWPRFARQAKARAEIRHFLKTMKYLQPRWTSDGGCCSSRWPR